MDRIEGRPISGPQRIAEAIDHRLDTIEQALFELLLGQRQTHQLLEAIMSEQSQVDTDVATLTAANQAIAASLTDIANQLTAISAELATAIANGQQPDLTALDALAASVQATATEAATVQSQADTSAAPPAAPAAPADPNAGQ